MSFQLPLESDMLIAIGTAKDENMEYGERRGASPLCVIYNPPIRLRRTPQEEWGINGG